MGITRLVNRAGIFQSRLSQNQLILLRELGDFLVQEAEFYTPVDTGNLRSNNTYEILKNELYIHNYTPYAKYVEFGTFKMRGRPFIGRAISENLGIIKEMAVRRFKSGID